MTDTTNSHGYRFVNGVVLPPQGVPTHDVHAFNPDRDEPAHSYDRHVTHAPYAHVMETMVEPVDPYFRYLPGMYVYVHEHAANRNPIDAVESVIIDVSRAPLAIMVHPCNHPEQAHEVRQDQLSAPIWV